MIAARRSLALLLLAACVALSGCTGICGSNSEAIARVRALPESRLAQLAAELAALPDEFYADEKSIPAVFQALKPLGVHSQSGYRRFVHLAGCVDDKIVLEFYPAEPPDRPRQLMLSLGKNELSEVVWRAR